MIEVCRFGSWLLLVMFVAELYVALVWSNVIG